MSQLLMFFDEPVAEPIEVGMFSYLRPKQGDSDYEQWLRNFAFFYHAAVRNGRTEDEQLYGELARHADELHCSLFAMKLGEEIINAMSDEEFQKYLEVRNGR